MNQTLFRIHSEGTVCVSVSIDSRGRTIHNAHHISLHSSSDTEPIHQSPHKSYIYVIDAAHSVHINSTAMPITAAYLVRFVSSSYRKCNTTVAHTATYKRRNTITYIKCFNAYDAEHGRINCNVCSMFHT